MDMRIQKQRVFQIRLARNQRVSQKIVFWICLDMRIQNPVETAAIYSKSAHGAYPNVSKRI